MIDLRDAKVLVTGGAGFIGSHTVDALADAGARVTVVDNLSTGLYGNIAKRRQAVTFHHCDIGNPKFEEIYDQVRPDYIYHFAHFVLVPKSVENPLLDMPVLTGTLRLLTKARQHGVKKIVVASSGFLYGNNPDLPVAETAPVDPIVPYAVSKQAIEKYVKVFNLPHVVLRYAAVYGPRQQTGAMADYIRQLTAGKQADIWGDGNKTRDYVYIADVVRANIMALSLPDSHPDPVFNIGTSAETTLNALYQILAGIIGVEGKPIYHPDRPGEQLRYALDASRAKRDLGWAPAWALDDGLRQTVAAALGEH
mgnify:CR=1 FL=1